MFTGLLGQKHRLTVFDVMRQMRRMVMYIL